MKLLIPLWAFLQLLLLEYYYEQFWIKFVQAKADNHHGNFHPKWLNFGKAIKVAEMMLVCLFLFSIFIKADVR